MTTTPKFSWVVLFFIIAILLQSCITRSNSETLIKQLEKTLRTSNAILENESQAIYSAMQEKVNDPQTREMGLVWQPKILKVQAETKKLVTFLEQPDLPLSKVEMWNSLKTQLERYTNKLKNIDPILTKEFNFELKEIAFIDSQYVDGKAEKLDFKALTAFENKAFITQKINSTRRLEKMLAAFISSQIVSDGIRCDFPKAFVTQNSMHFKKDETLEIKAGIGTFAVLVDQALKIDGKSIKMNDNGIFEQSFTTNEGVGKHFKKLTLQYVDRDGNLQKIEKRIEYIIEE